MAIAMVNHQLVRLEDAKVSIFDRGYNFGDGVYEVIRFYNQKLFRVRDHLKRLGNSLKMVDIQLDCSANQLLEEMDELVKRSGYINGFIYLQATRGTMERNHVYFGQNLKPQIVMYPVQKEERPMEAIQNGIKAFLTEDIRWSLCSIKSLNLLGNVLAKNEAARRGAEEAIFHRDGNITEGGSSNVFVVQKGKIYTHPANRYILNGITRLTVFEAAKELALEIIEEPFPVSDLQMADEVFTTATLTEITPVVSIESESFGKTEHIKIGTGKPGEITRTLQRKYEEYIFQSEKVLS